MAIANSDGSIILSTRIDTAGISKGMRQIALLGKKTGEQINLDFLFATKAIDKLSAALTTVQAKLLLVLAVKKFIDFSNASAKVAIQTEASVQRLVDIYGEASNAVGDFIDKNSKALGLSKATGASIAATYGNLLSVWADQATNAELTNALLNQTAVVASKTGRTTEDVAERIRSGLLGNTEAIEDLGINVNIKTIEITDAFKKIADGRSWEQLDAYEQSQVRTLAILEQSTKKYGNQVEETAATIRNRYDAAYQDFQNSWGNIVNTVLLPVLETLTRIFDIATKGLNALSGRSGQILENVELQEENTDKTAENIEEQTKNQKELNKELKKSLAGFDDIQILSANTADNTNGGGGGLGDLGLGGNTLDGSDYIEETSKTLEHIMRIVGAALVALGVILLISSPAKGWGIAFIIAGAATFGVSAAASIQEASDMGVGAVITTIMGIIGDALVAIGVVLLFKGSIQWGIGFIVAGAAMLAIEYFATTEFSTDPIINTLVKIMGIAGTALLALGIILCVFGVITPVSIGLIVAGAGLLVGALALSNDAIVEAIRGPIGIIMAIVSGALLVLGIILTCSGILPLGIGLIAAGAIGLATVVAINWNAIVEALQGPIGTITAIVSGALLVLGIILVCTGVGIPLGIGLILAGAAGLATVVAVNWNAIVDWVKGAWDAVKAFWNKYIAPVFTAKFWLDLAKTCGNGLIAGFEGAINGIIWLFESLINFVVDGLNLFIGGISTVTGAVGDLIGVNLRIPEIPKASLGRVSIPRLAQGTVVPPNKEFMAILGDNTKEHEIVSPVSTMKQAFMEAMVEMGGAGQTTKEEHYYLNETELMSIIYKLVKGGERISGTNLLSGGAF